MNPASATEWMSAPGHMVEASAGTGKTTRLVQEFVNAIQAGADVRRILAVTFTHAAAGDLKLRIRQKLDDALTTTTGVTRDRIRVGIEYLEQAYIGTIHGFCAQCLRQRPVEAALDPSFVELAEMESAALFAKVFKRWLEGRLAHGSPTLDRAFSRLAYRDEKNQDPIGPLLDAAWKLADWRDFPTPWRHPQGFDRDKLHGLLARVAETTADWKGASSNYQYLRATLFPAAELGDRVRIATEACALDDDSLEAELCYVGRRRYEQADFTALHNRLPNAYTQWQRLLTDLAAYTLDADANFAAELRDELWEMVLEYDLAKKAAGAVDFQDLLLKTKDLLHTQARAWFQQKFDHVFVDEFQDTDPLQAEILLLLTADDPAETKWHNVTPQPGKLFLVGDPKQSIYRFRRAEVALYRQVAQQLTDSGATTTPLATSYRSVLPIQQFVNSAFATTMEPYLALEGGRPPIPGQPGVVALPVPEIFSRYGRPTKGNIEKSAPIAVAGFIHWLLKSSGWQMTGKDGMSRPISENDICILFRRFTADATRGYVHSLECREIAHVLIGSKSLHEREEVMTLCAALKCIEHPDDELNLYATLRGALFAIEDADLFLYKQQHRFLSYTRIPTEHDEPAAKIITALHVLADLHKTRNHYPIAATISRLMERTRAHVSFALRPGGDRVLANVNRITDLARRFEMTTATSFRSFVEYLDDESGTKEAGEAPLLEQDAYGVKLMTVHKAKGLEFPVVILADPTYGSVGEGDRYTDSGRGLCVRRLLGCAPVELLEHQADEAAAEQAEADRLSYVAATRASELLVVSAIGIEDRQDGWLTPLEPALYPARDSWTHARKYPTFEGKRTVLNVPAKAAGVASVAPGWHKPIHGDHEVLWFDPALISPEPPLSSGVPTHELLAGDPAPTLATYQSWEAERDAAHALGRQATHKVIAATGGLAGTAPPAVEIERVAIHPSKREQFTRHFGRLVHQLLQDVDFAAPKAQIQTMARTYARRMRRPDLEATSAIEIVAAVLAHPLLLPARKATVVLREEPLVLRTEDGTIIEGKVDLAYRDSTQWTLVDYKVGPTDRREYERQMRWYAMALAASGNYSVRCVLFDIG